MLSTKEKIKAYRDLFLDLTEFRKRYCNGGNKIEDLKLYEVDYFIDQIEFKLRTLERNDRYGY